MIAGAAALALAGGAALSEAGSARHLGQLLKLALGWLLLALALKQWQGRPGAGAAGRLPGWIDSVDHFTAVRAGALGAGPIRLNPKNMVLIIAAATGDR